MESRNVRPVSAMQPRGASFDARGDESRGRGGFEERGSYGRNDSFARAGLGDRRGGMNENYRGGGFGGRFGTVREEPNPFMEAEFLERTMEQGINFDKYDDIPCQTSGRDAPEPIESFEILELPKSLNDNIIASRFTRPTPVQKYALPIALSARDLMACAQTGSGKTAAFLIPVIAMMIARAGDDDSAASGYNSRKSFPSALVLSPTRELTTQIFGHARRLMYKTGLRPVVIYGGADIKLQLNELNKGCNLIVATPGRLVDMLARARVSLAKVYYLVLDEADRMLDMGFEPQIREICSGYDMPTSSDRQTLMFSATFPKEIQRLASDFLADYVFLAVGRVGSTTESIIQKIEYVDERDKYDRLLSYLPSCDGLTLIFVETKRNADALEAQLYHEGITATTIHGDRTQEQRETALQEFRRGVCPVLVATDVASRGLDIPNVLHVINFDLPTQIDDYVHRIGRTGRCGNIGMLLFELGFVLM